LPSTPRLRAKAAAVDQAAQCLEDFRHAMNLVEDDEFVRVGCQIKFRLAQPRSVGFGLKIQIERRPGYTDFQREGGFADLAWAEQGHGRRAVEQMGEVWCDAPLDHPCDY